MTVYPLSFHVLGLEITGFGVMMMLGFLAAGWVMRRELIRRKLNQDYAADIIVAGVIGGIVGAKIWYAALRGDPTAFFSRSGLVWYGGFVGGTVAVLWQGARKHIPTRFTLELAAPALAVGHALGRVGCFVVQDDYGIPTSLPWGMRFPEGIPPTTAQDLAHLGATIPPGTPPYDILAVHPTQLYEVAALLTMFWFLSSRRAHRHAVGWLFACYLVLVGLERFLVEFIRAKDDRVLAGFTLAQGTSLVLIAIGIVLLRRWRAPDDLAVTPAGPLAPKAPG